ncbi:MAG: hypothetical protein CM1200mP28_07260 [Deltaproteobacteria bacterium]|nr:MAG: hypothetical protein CM1200mP28_07260 [Deltaproteobacteria bacterium]
MLIYAEGTRFTPEKHRRKNSPYKNLLKPRAGGNTYCVEQPR